MDPEVVIPAVMGIGVAYVVAPVLGVQLVSARKPQRVTCPDDHREQFVTLDLKRAAVTAFTGGPQHVRGCSRWPEKAGCNRACEAAIAV